MVNQGKRATRILMVAALAILVGCGGGSGDDGNGNGGCPAGEIGPYDVAIDITVACAANALEVWTGELAFLAPNEVFLRINVPETSGCCPLAIDLHGMESAPNTYDMDDWSDRLVCALEALYGYDSIGFRDAVLTVSGSDFQLLGQASVLDGAACLGNVTMDGTLVR